MQTLPTDVMDALKRARDTAMEQVAAARTPEGGTFANIAQDLDFAITQIEGAGGEEADKVAKYFLKAAHESAWKEVSLSEFCRAERDAGFYPRRLTPDHPDYMTTPATGSFGSRGMEGRVEYGTSKAGVRNKNGEYLGVEAW